MYWSKQSIAPGINSFLDNEYGDSDLRNFRANINSYLNCYIDRGDLLGYQTFDNYITTAYKSRHFPNENSVSVTTDCVISDDIPQSGDAYFHWGGNQNVYVEKVGTRPVHCEICDCHLNSLAQAECHFKGQSHQKKALMKQQENASMQSHGSSFTASPNDTNSALPDVCEDTFAVGDSIISKESSLERDGLVDPQNNCKDPPSKKKKVPHLIHCDFCNATFNSQEQAEEHFKGMKHYKKLRQLQKNLIETQQDQSSILGSLPSRNARFHCHLCNVSLNSSHQFNQHCTGQGHKRKVLSSSTPEFEVEGNKGGWFYCMACNVSCRTSLGLQRHTTSKEHKAIAGQKKLHQ